MVFKTAEVRSRFYKTAGVGVSFSKLLESESGVGTFVAITNLVLKYGTDVVPNLQTVVWLGLPESFVHNLALPFAQKHLCR